MTEGAGRSLILLTASEIHIWKAQISVILPIVEIAVLDPAEQSQVANVKSVKARNQFLVSRWSSRVILSRYLECEPGSIRFESSPEGKPTAVSELGIYFNRSHSGDWWAVAISRCSQIGIDLEEARERRQLASVVQRWFTEDEKKHFHDLPVEGRQSFFYTCWTRKEAVLKAAGFGLGHLGHYAALESQYFQKAFSPAPDYTGFVAQKTDGSVSPEIKVFSFKG